MPKIVDHDAHRKDLATRAAAYFSEHGYAGVSMRGIAAHLGVSKSALYHYFPNKEALFLACTEQVMARPQEGEVPEGASEAAQIEALMAQMRGAFGAEMALVFDYLRGKSQVEVAEDDAMKIALEAYLASVSAIVGPHKARAVLAQIMGQLILEHLSGGVWRD